jgi:hypothetical protein
MDQMTLLSRIFANVTTVRAPATRTGPTYSGFVHAMDFLVVALWPSSMDGRVS